MFFEFAFPEKLSRFLEFFILDELSNQIPARIVFVVKILRRLDVFGQHHPAFDVTEVRRHDEKFTGQSDVQHFESIDVLHVLIGDSFDGDVVNIDLVAFHEIKEEIQWAFEDLEGDFVRAIHFTLFLFFRFRRVGNGGGRAGRKNGILAGSGRLRFFGNICVSFSDQDKLTNTYFLGFSST